MQTGFDWTIVTDIGVGVGIFLFGLGTLLGMLALARTLRRVNATLDVVDEQVQNLGTPVGEMLTHIGGISETADKTVARLGGVADALENVAGTLSQTVTLAKNAVSPAMVNVGATLTGISAGLRRLVTGKRADDRTEQ